MADATLTSVEVIDGVLHLYGANYTQTTTVVLVDDFQTDHVFVSATELTVDPAPAAGASIEVEKGGVTSAAIVVPAASGSGGAAADTDPPAGGAGGNPGPDPIDPATLLTEQEKIAAAAPDDDPNKVPSDPKKPYPIGNPPTEEQERRRAMGLPREEPA
jgi:hypothetical protein